MLRSTRSSFVRHVRSLATSAALLPLLGARVWAQDDPAKPDTGPASKTETISVYGQRLSHGSLVPTQSSAATKTDTPLIDTPESVSVITRAQLDQQNARTLTEALRYVAGAEADSTSGFTTRYDLINIRGFEGANGVDEFLDGLKLFNGAFWATQQIDTALLEQVDILKGPPSVLYGQSNPGGVVVLTSKLPTSEPVHEVSLEGGTFGYVRGTLDLGGKLTQDGQLLYRLAATGTTSGTQDEHTRVERYGVAPSVSWLPSTRTTLTLIGFYQHEPRGGDYDEAPFIGTAVQNPAGELPANLYTGDDKLETFNRTQLAIGYQLSQQIVPNWTFRSTARYANVGTTYAQVYGSGLEADDTTYDRSAVASEEHYDTITLEEQVLGHFHTGPVGHSTLFGVSWQNIRDSYNYYGDDAPPVDIFAPNSNLPLGPLNLYTNESASTNQEGVFAQDQFTLGRWHFQIGAREDWSEIATRDALYNDNFDQFDRAFTWRAGVLYASTIGLSPYFNYSKSFQPQNSLSFAGTPFKPTTGEQYEVGLKYQPQGWRGFFTAALYDIHEKHVLVNDPVNLGFYIQTGGIRSQGVELEAHTYVTRNFNLIASYAYQKIDYTDGSGALDGERPTEDPAQFWSVWGHYDLPRGWLAGLGLGVGVRYTGDTIADNTLEYTTKSYALVDAELDYALGHLDRSLRGAKLQVTAQNLLNQRYIVGCYSAQDGCFFGATRNVIGRLSYDW